MGEKEILKEEIMDLEAQIKDMNMEVKKLRQESIDYEGKIVKMSKESKKLSREVDDRRKKLDMATADLQEKSKELNGVEKDIKNKFSEYNDIVVAIKGDYDKLHAYEESLVYREGKLKQEELAMLQEVKRYNALADECSNKIKILDQETVQIQKTIKSNLETSGKLNKTIAEYDKHLAELDLGYERLENEKEKLDAKKLKHESDVAILALEREGVKESQSTLNKRLAEVDSNLLEIAKLKEKLAIKTDEMVQQKESFQRQQKAVNAKEKEVELKTLRIKQLINKHKISDEIAQLEAELGKSKNQE